eukprot:1162007-Pelagomonas_calceolata.AAC.7
MPASAAPCTTLSPVRMRWVCTQPWTPSPGECGLTATANRSLLQSSPDSRLPDSLADMLHLHECGCFWGESMIV